MDDDDSRGGVASDPDPDPSASASASASVALRSAAVEASRLASSLASRNVVATVTVDRDAVGTAVIPLAEAAAVSASGAAASASASFSAPVTRFGRLCGVAEGELEVIVRGVGDE